MEQHLIFLATLIVLEIYLINQNNNLLNKNYQKYLEINYENKKIISIAILTALSSSITYANQEVYELYTVREKALGATTVANTKNSHQFNRNSALLSYKENFSLAFPKISFGISTDYVDNYETLEDLMDASKPLSEQMEDLKSLVPMDFSINAGIHPGLSVTMPNFGIKLYGTSQIAAKLLRKSSPTLYLAGSQSTIIQAGFSKEFFITITYTL